MATVIIGLLLAAVVVGIITRMVKNKKAGKSSCGCGCSGCPMSSECSKKQ